MENKPEASFKIGAVTAAIWKNKVDKGNTSFISRNVQLQRAYKDQNNQWQHTGSLKVNDLAKAIIALQKAQEYCFTVKDNGNEE